MSSAIAYEDWITKATAREVAPWEGKCTLCRLGESPENQSNHIGGRGPVPCDVMFIGEAPGRDEDKVGIPFVGRAGEKLSELMDRAGINEDTIRVTNMVRCRPPENRDPKPDEFAACLPYLLKEIEEVQPKVLVLMGNSALRLLGSGYRTVTKERGEVYNWNGCRALVTLHPASVLRKWEDEEVLVTDLKLVPRILKGESFEEENAYCTITDLEALRLLAIRLTQAREFSFDLETTSLDWRREEILSISFSDEPKTAFVVPLLGQHRSPIWKEEELPEVRSLLRQILESDVPKGGQNIKYDIKFLRFHLGIHPKNIAFDTTLMFHTLDENLPSNLEFLASYYLGIPRHDKELRDIVTKREISFDVVPNEILWKYTATDADTTLRLKHYAEPKVDWTLQRRICLPLARALTEMEMCGVYIDLKKLEENSRLYAQRIGEQAQKIYELVGYDFKITPRNLSAALFAPKPDGLGLPVAGVTGAGNPTTQKDALEELYTRLKSEGFEGPELQVLKEITEYNSLKHWKTTFVDGREGDQGLKRWIHEDSRIYPSYRQTGTDMGRLAIREPNLQNIPRDKDLRQQFAAPPGWICVHADASQAEPRAGAIVANCQAMLDAMSKGLNIHRAAAAKLNHIPYGTETPKQYETVKFVTHGLHYGRGIPSIAGEYGLSLREVQDFVEAYFQGYPELAELMLSQVEKVTRGEPIVNRFGRVRHFPSKITGHEKRVAISFAFASNWADAMNLLTSRVYERLTKEGLWFKDVKMTMSVHDALFFEIREGVLEKAMSAIIEALESPVEELDNYCFPWKIKAGSAWESLDSVLIWEGK